MIRKILLGSISALIITTQLQAAENTGKNPADIAISSKSCQDAINNVLRKYASWYESRTGGPKEYDETAEANIKKLTVAKNNHNAKEALEVMVSMYHQSQEYATFYHQHEKNNAISEDDSHALDSLALGINRVIECLPDNSKKEYYETIKNPWEKSISRYQGKK